MNQPMIGMKRSPTAAPWLAALLLAGCAAPRAAVDRAQRNAPSTAATASAMRALALDRSRTRPLGRGARFRPPPISALVRAHAPLGWLRCRAAGAHPYAAHIELFAQAHEIAVPAGIGIAPPQHHQGASVDGGACSYPVRTADPTGVVLIDAPSTGQAQPTVDDLFKLWGQPLSRHRLASFTVAGNGSVAAFVDGRRVLGPSGAIPLRRHVQIVLEIGPHVQPHPSYRFTSGL
jgi:hypothetical protein